MTSSGGVSVRAATRWVCEGGICGGHAGWLWAGWSSVQIVHTCVSLTPSHSQPCESYTWSTGTAVVHTRTSDPAATSGRSNHDLRSHGQPQTDALG